MIVEGQLHGGIVQGIGQALFENCVYDEQSGQLLSGSFMDYCMPRADQPAAHDGRDHSRLHPHARWASRVAARWARSARPLTVINAVVDALAAPRRQPRRHACLANRIWRIINAAACSDAE